VANAGGTRQLVAALATACLVSFYAAPSEAAVEGRTAARAAPAVSAELPVSNPVETAPDGGGAFPTMAFDGTNYLVVWTDQRSHWRSSYDVYGSRVTPSGEVLDPGGIPIATSPSDEAQARVAFGGGTFLVVWAETDRSSGARDVRGARVSPSGAVLDPGGIPMSSAAGAQTTPDVAFGGSSFLVVWGDTRADTVGPPQAFGSRVSAAGSVLDPEGIRIATPPSGAYGLAVAAGADRFLVAWHQGSGDNTDVVGARIDPSGSVLDPDAVPIATAPGFQTAPAIAFNGTEFLVAWHDDADGSGTSGARVSPSGSVLDPDGIAIAVATTSDGEQRPPSVTALGSTFLVAWHDGRAGGANDLYGARISSAGANLDPSGLVLAGSVGGWRVGLASDGTTYFATWTDARYGGAVFGTAISDTGVAHGPGTLVSRAANSQRESAVASDGTNSLVVWSDNRSGRGYQVFGTRIDPSGRVIDAGGIPISQGSVGSNPAVAFDGTNYVIAWEGEHDVMVVVMSPSGLALGSPSVITDSPRSDQVFDLDVAATSAGSVVTCSLYGPRSTGVAAWRISPDGRTVDGAVPLAAGHNSRYLSVATDGHDFLLTWAVEGPVINAAFLRAGTTVPEPTFDVAGDRGQGLDVASNGRRYLVVWSDGDAIRAARITTAGELEDPAGITVAATSSGVEPTPTVAANGPFMVAWREADDPLGGDIRGARVDDDGSLLDGSGFTIAAADTLVSGPSLSRGPGATWTASYTRFRPERHYGSDRVFLRTISPK
jgi:hypothetical protein